MLNMPSRIRQEKLAIAQSRAMEEQKERENPLAHHRGAGATPSMGLSPYWGGKMDGEESESDESVGGIIHRRMSGKGTKKGQQRKTARRAYEPKSMDEATAMGLHLAKHLHGLHGDDFLQKFGAGIVGGAMMCEGRGAGMSGGNFFDDLKHAFSDEVWNPEKNGVAQAFRDFGENVKHEFVDPNSTLRGTVLPMAEKVGSVLSMVPGVGEVLAPVTGAISLANKANQAAKSIGLGRRKGGLKARSGAYEGEGTLRITHEGSGMKEDILAKFKKGKKVELPMDFIAKERMLGAPVAQYATVPMVGMKGEGWWSDLKDAAKSAAQTVVSEVMKDPQGALDKAKKGYEIGKQVYSAVKGKGGKKHRAKAGPNDGRRKRAEVVKKVMREKGLSMIEASKYVKQHNLY